MEIWRNTENSRNRRRLCYVVGNSIKRNSRTRAGMKIIYYMPLFLKLQAEKLNNKKLDDFCELFKIVSPNASIIDRSNAFDTPFDIHILYGIPERPVSVNLNYDEVCIARAEEILKENKNIVIFYSGGLDSTVVVLSFWLAIQNGIG